MAEPSNSPSSCPRCVEQEREIAGLKARVAQLERLLEDITRKGKRQASAILAKHAQGGSETTGTQARPGLRHAGVPRGAAGWRHRRDPRGAAPRSMRLRRSRATHRVGAPVPGRAAAPSHPPAVQRSHR